MYQLKKTKAGSSEEDLKMETKDNKQELNLDEMQQVSGGTGNTKSQPDPEKPRLVISSPKASDIESNYPLFR